MKSIKVHIKNLSYLDKLKIDTLSNEHRLVYNYVLNYIKESGDLKFSLLFNEAIKFRKEQKLTISAKSTQNTIRSLVFNLMSYFASRKKDPNARFPKRFKSWKYFTSFIHNKNHDKIDSVVFNKDLSNLSLKLLNKHTINFNLPIYIQEKLKSSDLRQVIFQKNSEDYILNFVVNENIQKEQLNVNKFISIDPGLTSITTCYSNEVDSFQIKNQRFKDLYKQITKVQSLRDRKKVGSRKHKKISKTFRKLNKKIVNKRKDFQHKVSKHIIDKCIYNKIGTLIVGDIKTKKLTQSKVSNKHLNRSTQNEGTLSRFISFLGYKAKNQGIHFIKQNEAYTSQTNCLTHERNLSSDLKHRKVKISNKLTIDRDLNSAINIAYKNKAKWLSHFDEEKLMNISNSFQEMFYDIKCDKMIKLTSVNL